MFNDIYKSRRVAVTGHTGFKGSWLSIWLSDLEAELTGFSIDVPTDPSHYDELGFHPGYEVWKDVSNKHDVDKFLNETNPELLIHMAAQSLVRPSYDDPLSTILTNTMGTANVLDAARRNPNVKAVIIVTSDKCYENLEIDKGYIESDRMGGHDPYSASKACAEIVTECYRRCFTDRDNLLIASARVGNVIGGGDWSKDRLIPDIARAARNGEEVTIRRPNSIRPWQHVLEPLSGYLLLGQRLLEGDVTASGPWNFGPTEDSTYTVNELVNRLNKYWQFKFSLEAAEQGPHEAGALKLNCSKAQKELNWNPVWSIDDALKYTAEWYQDYISGQVLRSEEQYYLYLQDAQLSGAAWMN